MKLSLRGISLTVAGTAVLLLGACGGMPVPDDPLAHPGILDLVQRRAKAGKRPLVYHLAVAPPEFVVVQGDGEVDTGERDEREAASRAVMEPVRPAADKAGETAQPESAATGEQATGDGEQAEIAGGVDKATRSQSFDPVPLQQRFAANLRELGLFRKVSAIKPFKQGESEKAQRATIMNAADELNADLVLCPRFKRYDTSYVESTGWWVPSWLTGFVLWFPTFWFPDERWAATVELEWELIHLRTGETMWSTSDVERTLAAMNDFDRGWDVFGPWGIPLFTNSFLGVEDRNFRKVGESLLPVSVSRAEGELLLRLGEYLDKNPITAKGASSQTFCLVIGVNSPGHGTLPNLCCAARDAIAIADYLKDPNGAAVGSKRISLLVNQDATYDKVSEFFDVQLQMLSERDRVFVYFAGYAGRDRSGNGYLTLFDTDPSNLLGTGLPIEKITNLFGREQRATVILDTSFGGKRGRTIRGQRRGGEGKPFDRGVLEAAAQLRRGSFLFAASDVEESAQEYEPEGHGIFTLVLLQGLYAADVDEDGQVSLGEVVRWVEEQVPSASSALGERQRPLFLSKVPEDAEQRIMSRQPAPEEEEAEGAEEKPEEPPVTG
ncbi:caspase domain-containing protein [Planctomycetota bacterium]